MSGRLVLPAYKALSGDVLLSIGSRFLRDDEVVKHVVGGGRDVRLIMADGVEYDLRTDTNVSVLRVQSG